MSEMTPPEGVGPKRRNGRNRKLVLDALRAAERPLGAYELLGQLRSEGLRSPLQVYRALHSLIAEGSVHKIESVSAYTLCKEKQHACGGLVVFAICSNCGQASESRDPALDRLMERLARQQGFKVQGTTVELSGLCEACTHAG